MGAVKDFFLGSKPKYKVNTVPTLLPEQQDLLTSLISVISPQLGGGVPAYGGDLVAPLSPLQQSVLKSAQSLVEPLTSLFSQGLQTFSSSPSEISPMPTATMPSSPPMPTATMPSSPPMPTATMPSSPPMPTATMPSSPPMPTATMPSFSSAVSPSSLAKDASFWKGLMTAFTPEPWDKSGAEEYWRKAFVAPAEQKYWQQVVPQLTEKFAGSNAIDSSAFARAMTSSGANLATNLGSELAKTLMQDRENWRNFYLGTLGAGANLARTALGDITSARNYSLEDLKSARDYSLGDLVSARNYSLGNLKSARDYSLGDLVSARNFVLGNLKSARDYSLEDLISARNFVLGNLKSARDYSLGDLVSARNFVLGDLKSARDYSLGDLVSARNYSLGQQKLGLARQELGLRATEDALNQLMNLSNLGDIERQINQAQLQADYKKWLQSQPYNNPWLNYLPLAITTPAFALAPVVKGGSPGYLSTVMGSLGKGVGMGLGMGLGTGLGGLFLL